MVYCLAIEFIKTLVRIRLYPQDYISLDIFLNPLGAKLFHNILTFATSIVALFLNLGDACRKGSSVLHITVDVLVQPCLDNHCALSMESYSRRPLTVEHLWSYQLGYTWVVLRLYDIFLTFIFGGKC